MYTDFLIREIFSCNLPDTVTTVFIGGGTPSSLPLREMEKLLSAINSLPLSSDVEVTVECNPKTVSPDYLKLLNEQNVNRLSFGVQTTIDSELKNISRQHTYADFLDNYEAARQVGFANINVDLMFNLPGQTAGGFSVGLKKVIALSPEHISCYSLTPAENTPLWNDLRDGRISLPDDETDRLMYHTAKELLKDSGYTHYEISNFCKPGFFCRHNVDLWQYKPYIGFGLGAHSFDGAGRWNNPTTFDDYFGRKGHNEQELTTAEMRAEAVILALRLTDGFFEDEFCMIHGFRPSVLYADKLQELAKKGLIHHSNKRIALTPLGLDLANQVFLHFLSEE